MNSFVEEQCQLGILHSVNEINYWLGVSPLPSDYTARTICAEVYAAVTTVGPRGSAVERQSLASILSPSCARPVADG